jgi:hypothetical protein
MELNKTQIICILWIFRMELFGDIFAREKNTDVFRIRGDSSSFLIVEKNLLSIFSISFNPFGNILL